MTDTTITIPHARPGHDEVTWEPPGPGSWTRDDSHAGPAPTRFFRRIASQYTKVAYAGVLEEWGGALATLDLRFVNGDMYRRLVPLIGADKDRGKVPPAPVLWLATRLHPAFRERTKRAAAMMRDRPYLDVIDGWTSEREEWNERNRALTAIDPASLPDAELADHLRDLDRHAIAGWLRHHELHGSDMGPIGDLLHHTAGWNLDPVEVMALLKGSSPATVDAARHAAGIADALGAAGIDPTTVRDVDTIRSVDAASALLDAYLDEFGWRLITGYDLEDLTLVELPAAICSIVRAAAAGDALPDGAGDAEAEGRLRSAAGDPALFDELLDGARRAYGMRDDNGPLTWEWPAGLVRRACLDAGRRLATDGRLARPDLVFELDVDELAAVLDGGVVPDDVDERARVRAHESTLVGPPTLGPQPDREPDLDVFPAPLARTMKITLAATSLLDVDPQAVRRPLHGLGIGAEPYIGTARVAIDPAVAVSEMEPGDVLVAPWTAPSYNAVLSIAGAIVVQEGGLLCHAAVMARELELPAVIGCHEAMSAIQSGDRIEVDPTAGVVRILTPTAS